MRPVSMLSIEDSEYGTRSSTFRSRGTALARSIGVLTPSPPVSHEIITTPNRIMAAPHGARTPMSSTERPESSHRCPRRSVIARVTTVARHSLESCLREIALSSHRLR